MKGMTPFDAFASAVNTRYLALRGSELYQTQIDDLFSDYLAAFPAGTNPIFRNRTEHDCQTCKQFIRRVGGLVAIDHGERKTVWDVRVSLPEPYRTVADLLADRVRSAPIVGVFRTKEAQYGAERTRSTDGLTFAHFAAPIATQHRSGVPDQQIGASKASYDVFTRGLEELQPAALTQVLELIDANALYRGAEFRAAVEAFRRMQSGYQRATDREAFRWAHHQEPVARFRNSVIGTLVTDLSSGVELEQAVRSFEQKVAPENYKRPTALITPKMIDQALDTIRTLGLEDALARRYARAEDLSVEDVLFVDNAGAARIRGLREELLAEATATTGPVPTKTVTIEEFLGTIVPKARSISLLVEPEHLEQCVSLTAPQYPDAGKLFRWDNPYAWSYDGDFADAIKSRVQKAGGKLGQLRVSLSWFNTDDLDLELTTPRGEEISFRRKASSCGGVLDVDMNVSHPVRDPVENITWTRTPPDGQYRVRVNQFRKRESKDVGFTLDVEAPQYREQFHYRKAVAGNIPSLTLTLKGGKLVDVSPASTLQRTAFSVEKWGIRTGQVVPVDLIVRSPNHWNGAVGNLHWFFILRGMKNPGSTRGIYNEFLRSDLEAHRKVFEVLGAKTQCAPSDQQLSGLGFSSTRPAAVTALVNGRSYRVTFAGSPA